MNSTAWLLNSSYISFPALLGSFFSKISELRLFIITGFLLPSSIQATFIFPWLVMLEIRRHACGCYWFQHHAQDIKMHGWNSDCTGEVWMLCKTKGRFWTPPLPLFRTCFTRPWDYFSASPWNDELKPTAISGVHADPLLAIMEMVLHLVNITLAWIRCRKSCLHCCFQGNYINTYLFCDF